MRAVTVRLVPQGVAGQAVDRPVVGATPGPYRVVVAWQAQAVELGLRHGQGARQPGGDRRIAGVRPLVAMRPDAEVSPGLPTDLEADEAAVAATRARERRTSAILVLRLAPKAGTAAGVPTIKTRQGHAVSGGEILLNGRVRGANEEATGTVAVGAGTVIAALVVAQAQVE